MSVGSNCGSLNESYTASLFVIYCIQLSFILIQKKQLRKVIERVIEVDTYVHKKSFHTGIVAGTFKKSDTALSRLLRHVSH